MNREKEFKKIKQIIKENIKDGDCGLYDSCNITGDTMIILYKGKYFQVEICYNYSYFEVFGATDEEFKELQSFYKKLRGEKNENN